MCFVWIVSTILILKIPTDNSRRVVEGCNFRWLGNELSISDYFLGRLVSYLLSTIPLIFSAAASRIHIKNKLDEFIKEPGKFSSIKDSDIMGTIEILLIFLVHVVMGSLVLVMDINAASSLSNTCTYFIDMLFCDSSVLFVSGQLRPDKVPIPLVVFGTIYTVWGMLCTITNSIKSCTSVTNSKKENADAIEALKYFHETHS